MDDLLSKSELSPSPYDLEKQKCESLELELEELKLDFAKLRHVAQDRLIGQSLVQEIKNEASPILDSKIWDMDGYFSGYSHFDIHETMLKDKARTEAYRGK